MAEKFNPAAHDKYAVDPREAAKADGDRENESLWDKVRAVFR